MSDFNVSDPFADARRRDMQPPPERQPGRQASSGDACWDPAGKPIAAAALRPEVERVKAWAADAAADPGRASRRRWGMVTLIAIGVLCGAAVFLYLPTVGLNALLPAVIIPLVGGAFFLRDGAQVADARKLAYAESHGWLYNPARSAERWSALNAVFPVVFKKGGMGGRHIQDEWWKAVRIGPKDVDVWLGLFEYVVRQGKHSTTYVEHAVALRLPRRARLPFAVVKEDLGKRMKNFFTRRDLETASEEFDHAFTVVYEGDKEQALPALRRVFMPPLQQALLRLGKDKDGVSMAVAGDALMLLFPNAYPVIPHSDDPALSAVQEAAITEQLEGLMRDVEEAYAAVAAAV
jgi:hypothetical protein